MSSKPQTGEVQDDPHEIANWLIREHGLIGARQVVLGGVLEAQEQGDFYRLSVYREVRRILAQYPDEV